LRYLPRATGLLEIRRLLTDCGRKLTLCGVAPAIKGVFIIARLDDLFEFVEDRVGLHPIDEGPAQEVVCLP